jgi:DNA-binding NarL/FixJ family response regulator
MDEAASTTKPSSPAPTTVLVVDDHRTVADAVALAVEREPDLMCVGTAHSAAEAASLVGRLKPDAVVMDVRLGDGDGIVTTAELVARHPGLRVVVLSAFVDQALLVRAADAGACALLPKNGSLSDLIEALRSSRGDGFVVHPTLLRALMRTGSDNGAHLRRLTQREQDVLRMLAEGDDATTIARNLGISVNTCRGYVKSILAKLDAHTQLEAVVLATRLGLIRVSEHG